MAPDGSAIIKTIANASNNRLFEIRTDDLGLFQFTEYCRLWDDGYGAFPGSWYWSPTYTSGLYDTANGAENDARAILPWLNSEDAT